MSLNGNSGFAERWVDDSGIPSGACFDYNFTVGEQTGTYWIHSHVVGQYPNGLRAPFIIHDCNPPYHYDDELVLSVSDWVCLLVTFSDVQYNQTMQVLIPEFLSPENPDGAEPVPDSKTTLSIYVSNSRCVDLGSPKWHTKRHTRLHRSIPSSQHWCVRILPLLDRVAHFDCHRS